MTLELHFRCFRLAVHVKKHLIHKLTYTR